MVLAPHTLSGMTSIEKMQRYATRFICSEYSRYSSVTEMLQSLSLPPLRYSKVCLVFMYKILHQVVGVSAPHCYLTPVSWNTHGHPLRFIQLQTNIDAYKLFYPSAGSAIRLFPTYVIEANSLDDFQTFIS